MFMVDIKAWIRAKLDMETYQKEDLGSFRIGQSYSQLIIDKVSRRDDIGYFYTTAIVEMAFKDGFQIEDKDDKRVDALSDELEGLNWLSSIKRGASFDRKHGSVTFVLFDEGTLVPFKRDNVEFRVDRYGDFTAFKLKERR